MDIREQSQYLYRTSIDLRDHNQCMQVAQAQDQAVIVINLTTIHSADVLQHEVKTSVDQVERFGTCSLRIDWARLKGGEISQTIKAPYLIKLS